MDYLLKTEPSEYSFAELQKDGETAWDGVTNPTAVMHLRGMKAGDRLVIYETGNVKSAVGTAEVVSVDASDPKKPVVKIKRGKGAGEAGVTRGDQEEPAVQGFAAGEDGEIVGGAADRGAVQGACGSVKQRTEE